MNEHVHKRLLDLKARQLAGEHLPCPRCGRDTMKVKLHTNALSRHADMYICDECGTAEAMLDFMNNPLPLLLWACMKNDLPRTDFRTLPAKLVFMRIESEQIPYLCELYERWRTEPEPKHSRQLEYCHEAYRRCPGLTTLICEPFQATYRVAEGRLLIRFKKSGEGVGYAVDILP